MTTSVLAVAILVFWGAFSGCARTVYNFGIPGKGLGQQQPFVANPIRYGGEHPRLDRIENTIRYPAKKLKQWFGKPEVAPLPEDLQREMAVAKAQEYLFLNQLNEVRIDVREYDPKEQWRRLRANQEIAPFWKYTAGTLDHLHYCLLPGRVTHRDSFNIFTNTLSINSTKPAHSLYASATAKYMHSKRYPGAFEAACSLPIVPLYRDYHVGSDLLTYVRVRKEWEFEKEMVPEIYGNFGSDAISQATSLIPTAAYLPFYAKPVLRFGGTVAGKLTGRWIIKTREWEEEQLGQETMVSPLLIPSVEEYP